MWARRLLLASRLVHQSKFQRCARLQHQSGSLPRFRFLNVGRRLSADAPKHGKQKSSDDASKAAAADQCKRVPEKPKEEKKESKVCGSEKPVEGLCAKVECPEPPCEKPKPEPPTGICAPPLEDKSSKCDPNPKPQGCEKLAAPPGGECGKPQKKECCERTGKTHGGGACGTGGKPPEGACGKTAKPEVGSCGKSGNPGGSAPTDKKQAGGKGGGGKSGCGSEPPKNSPQQGNCARFQYFPEVELGINSQIRAELQASYFYTSLASTFGRLDVSLRGLESYFWRCANQERNDAIRLADYQNRRGGVVVLTCIEDPGCSARTTNAKEALTNSIHLQRSLTTQLLNLYKVANDKDDPVTCDFLSEHFLMKQVKRLSRNGRYITQLNRVGDTGLALHDFDEWLFCSAHAKEIFAPAGVFKGGHEDLNSGGDHGKK